jgi:hypothetical protein
VLVQVFDPDDGGSVRISHDFASNTFSTLRRQEREGFLESNTKRFFPYFP